MGRRGSDDEDEALWARVVETAAPLKRRAKAAGSAKAVPPAAKPAKLAAKQREAPQLPAVKPSPAPKPGHVPRAAPLDRQTARQLVKGRLEVDAKLDLHGMRQRDAYAQLRRFLKTAQARGLKHVLVITGKGAVIETSKSFYEEEERGVLRSAVPRWLAEADFAPLVVSYSPAPPRLGGEGALYVRVRRSKV
jgi:DNA-nicking Smr family endonuclease